MILQSRVVREKVMAAFDGRRTVLLVVPERGQPCPDRGPLGNGFEKSKSDLVLGLDPGPGRRRVGILQRTVRIGNLGSVIDVGSTVSWGFGIVIYTVQLLAPESSMGTRLQSRTKTAPRRRWTFMP